VYRYTEELKKLIDSENANKHANPVNSPELSKVKPKGGGKDGGKSLDDEAGAALRAHVSTQCLRGVCAVSIPCLHSVYAVST
jgi:hypothetical protein